MRRIGLIILIFFTIVSISSILIYAWNIANQTADDKIFLIIPINNLTGSRDENDTQVVDFSGTNQSTNFVSGGAGGFPWIIDGGRDGDGAYQFFVSSGNFLRNASNPFRWTNSTGGTLCWQWYPNGTRGAGADDTTEIFSFGNGAGESSGALYYSNTNGVFNFNHQCNSGTDSSGTLPGSFGTPALWHTMCWGWTNSSFWIAIINETNSPVNDSTNPTFFAALATPAGGCGNAPDGATGRNVRFGAGVTDALPSIDMAFDAITAWSINLTWKDILTYHQGNWTTTLGQLNVSTPLPENLTIFSEIFSIDFNATVNATRNINASIYINFTSGSNALVWNASRDYSAGPNVYVNFTVTFPNTGQYRWVIRINDTQGHNVSTNETVFEIRSIISNFNNTNPIYLNGTYFKIGTININFSVNATNAFWINVSINGTAAQTGGWISPPVANMTRAGGQSIKISNVSISLSDGDYIVIVNLTDTAGNNNQTIPQWFFIDRTVPNIAYHNPPFPTNLSNRNLSINLSVADNRIFNASILVWRQRELVHALYYDRNNASVTASTSNFSINTTLNFTIDYNYTIESIVYDGNGTLDSNILRQNSTYYYDPLVPFVNITYPRNFTGNIIGVSSFNLSVNVIENTTLKDATCTYYVNETVTNNDEVPRTTFNCTSADISVTQNAGTTDYTIYVEINDKFYTTEKSVNFSISTSSGGDPPSGGGGGGGPATGGTTITEEIQEIIKNLIAQKKIDYTFKTTKGASKANLYAYFEHQRMIEVVVDNLKETIPLVNLSCEGSDCDWITFQNQSFSVTGGSKVVVPVTINVPPEAQKGSHAFKLLATVGTEVRAIDLTITVGFIGKLIKPRNILFFNTSPASLATTLFIFISMGSAFVFAAVIKEATGRKYIALYSLIIGFASAVAIIVSII